MHSSLNHDIRHQLARYLTGEISLEVFGDWFVPATWDIDKTGDQPTIDLTYEIILRLAEYSNGDCTEGELKQILRPLVEPAVIQRTLA
jgi:hypothetical protein